MSALTTTTNSVSEAPCLLLVSLEDNNGILLREQLCFPKHLFLTWEAFKNHLLNLVDVSKIVFPYYRESGTGNLFLIDPSYWPDYLPLLSEVLIKCHIKLIVNVILEDLQDSAATPCSESEKLEGISTTKVQLPFRREAAKSFETSREISIPQLRIDICRLFKIREPEIRDIRVVIGNDSLSLGDLHSLREFLDEDDEEELDLIVERH